MIYYGNKWTLENAVYMLVSLFFIAAFYFRVLPHALLSLLLSLTLPLSATSKLAQMYTIYQIKSRGNVSVVTWSLASYGCLARLFTLYVEVGDMQILLNFFVSFILNSLVVIMCLYYGSEKKL